MRVGWNALRESLVSSACSLEAARQFKELQRQPPLTRFSEPVALLDYLNDRRGDPNEKDRIYRILVLAVQQGGATALAATPVVWLGLWPGLDAIFRRRVKHFRSAPDELVSELTANFLGSIRSLCLAEVNRIAATLLRNTERPISEQLRDRWAEPKQKARLQMLTLPEATQSATPPIFSQLGIPGGLQAEEELAVVRSRVVEMHGPDTDLVISVLIEGETQLEVATRLGLSHDAARKRVQRARARLSRGVSHFLAKSAFERRRSHGGFR